MVGSCSAGGLLQCGSCESGSMTLQDYPQLMSSLLTVSGEAAVSLEQMSGTFSQALPTLLELCQCQACHGIDRSIADEFGNINGVEALAAGLKVFMETVESSEGLDMSSKQSVAVLTLEALRCVCFMSVSNAKRLGDAGALPLLKIALYRFLASPEAVHHSVGSNVLILITLLALNTNAPDPVLLLDALKLATSVGQLKSAERPAGDDEQRDAMYSGLTHTALWSVCHILSECLLPQPEAMAAHPESLMEMQILLSGDTLLIVAHCLAVYGSGPQDEALLQHCLQFCTLLASPSFSPWWQTESSPFGMVLPVLVTALCAIGRLPHSACIHAAYLECLSALISAPYGILELGLSPQAVADLVLNSMASVTTTSTNLPAGDELSPSQLICLNDATLAQAHGLTLLADLAHRGYLNSGPPPVNLVHLVHEAISCICQTLSTCSHAIAEAGARHQPLPDRKCRYGTRCLLSHQPPEDSLMQMAFASSAVLLRWVAAYTGKGDGVNSTDAKGRTVLHKVALAGLLDHCRVFVDVAGANLDLGKRDTEGMDASEMAGSRDADNLVLFLLEARYLAGQAALNTGSNTANMDPSSLSECLFRQGAQTVPADTADCSFLSITSALPATSLANGNNKSDTNLFSTLPSMPFSTMPLSSGVTMYQELTMDEMFNQMLGQVGSSMEPSVRPDGMGSALGNIMQQQMGVDPVYHGAPGTTSQLQTDNMKWQHGPGKGSSMGVRPGIASPAAPGSVYASANSSTAPGDVARASEDGADQDSIPCEGRPSRFLWLGNISLKPSKAALELLFGAFGGLESVRVFPGRTHAFISFQSPADGILAKVTLDGQPAPVISGTRPMIIRFQDAPPPHDPGFTDRRQVGDDDDVGSISSGSFMLPVDESSFRSASTAQLSDLGGPDLGAANALNQADLLSQADGPAAAMNLSNRLNPNNVHFDKELAGRYKRMSKVEKERLWEADRMMAHFSTRSSATAVAAASLLGLPSTCSANPMQFLSTGGTSSRDSASMHNRNGFGERSSRNSPSMHDVTRFSPSHHGGPGFKARPSPVFAPAAELMGNRFPPPHSEGAHFSPNTGLDLPTRVSPAPMAGFLQQLPRRQWPGDIGSLGMSSHQDSSSDPSMLLNLSAAGLGGPGGAANLWQVEEKMRQLQMQTDAPQQQPQQQWSHSGMGLNPGKQGFDSQPPPPPPQQQQQWQQQQQLHGYHHVLPVAQAKPQGQRAPTSGQQWQQQMQQFQPTVGMGRSGGLAQLPQQQQPGGMPQQQQQHMMQRGGMAGDLGSAGGCGGDGWSMQQQQSQQLQQQAQQRNSWQQQLQQQQNQLMQQQQQMGMHGSVSPPPGGAAAAGRQQQLGGVPLGRLSAPIKLEAPMEGATSTPSSFVCPLTGAVMREPVMAADGVMYERDAISRWMACNLTSPVTGEPLCNQFLAPNVSLRAAIVRELGSRGGR